MAYGSWPKSVQNSVIVLVAGWLGVYAFMAAFDYLYGQHDRIFSNRLILQALILGVGLSFFVIRGKNWARVISIFGNAVPTLLSLAYLAFVHVFHTVRLNWLLSGIALWIAVCFGLSIFYLTRPATAAHFRLSSAPVDGNSTDGLTNS